MSKVNKKAFTKKIENLYLDVLGFPYKVKFVEDLVSRFNITGCASVWGSDIQLDPSVSNLDILSSLLHEVIEVMLRKTETKFEHELVTRFETFLMLLIIDNPELMELILETTKKEGGPIKGRTKKRAKELVKRRKGKSGV
jgi:hypothetical protein